MSARVSSPVKAPWAEPEPPKPWKDRINGTFVELLEYLAGRYKLAERVIVPSGTVIVTYVPFSCEGLVFGEFSGVVGWADALDVVGFSAAGEFVGCRRAGLLGPFGMGVGSMVTFCGGLMVGVDWLEVGKEQASISTAIITR